MLAKSLRCVLIAAWAASWEGLVAADALPRVPRGFSIEKVAASPLVKHPMLAGFDDRGRLYVASSAGKNLKRPDLEKDPPNYIQRLEDTDGDGRFDKSTIFADKMTLPMGALWYRGSLFVASPPNIWKLTDTDDDGVADKREILVDQFGYTGNAASIHGCFLGPCGRIYWCDGRHGHEFRDSQGNIVSKGKAARIFSCRPDGSDVRVFAGGGMDNPVEIDFTEEGEMLGTVNIMYSRPRIDTLVHWVEGGVYPRYDQEDCLAEFKHAGEPLGAVAKLGHVAVSGMCRYRSDDFGKEYNGNVFITEFNTHKVVRAVLKRSGSTFTAEVEDFLVSDDPDFHPTDVLEDADGSLLVIDTGGWFRIGCPVSKVAKPEIHGAIYRIRREGTEHSSSLYEVMRGIMPSKPRRVADLLDHDNPFLREMAIERLAAHGEAGIRSLSKIATREVKRSETSRRNAVWALSRITDGNPQCYIAAALSDPAESVRLAAACAIDVRILEAAAAEEVLRRLAELVVNDTPPIRREAARALGRNLAGGASARVHHQAAINGIAQSLAQPGNDRILEHSLIYALIQFRRPELTGPLLGHKQPAVRRAALIALDQMDGGNLTREMVVPLLDTDDAALQKTALQIIARHKGWARETLSLVRKWMSTKTKPTAERTAVLRGFLVAQSADKAVQSLLAELLLSPKTDTAKRLLLLEVIGRSSLRHFPDEWKSSIRAALKWDDHRVQLEAVRVVAARPRKFDQSLGPELRSVALNAKNPIELRAEAFIAAAPALKQIDDRTLESLIAELKKDHPPLTTLTIARALSVLPLNEPQARRLAETLRAAGPLEAPVLLRGFEGWGSAVVGTALVEALLDSRIAASVSVHELNRVLKGFPQSVREKAKPLLAKLGVDPAEQERRIAELLTLTNGGSVERGRAVFFSKKAACAGCHAVENEGGRVGPDLTTIGGSRSPRDLLEALVFPSANFARGFRTYIVVTDEGRIHTGVVTRQSADSITLRTAELAELHIPRSSIEKFKESPVSIMPKGLDQTLSPAELRDVIAFLKSRQ